MDEAMVNASIRSAARRARLRIGRAGAVGADHGLSEGLDDAPCSLYGLMTRQSLERLEAELVEVKHRVNMVLWGVGTAVLIDVVMRLMGR